MRYKKENLQENAMYWIEVSFDSERNDSFSTVGCWIENRFVALYLEGSTDVGYDDVLSIAPCPTPVLWMTSCLEDVE